MPSDSVLDERTLREIYPTNFEIAVKEGHPHHLMTSCNRVIGVYANENAHLLQNILGSEWGYFGAVLRVLSGQANPSGKLSETFALSPEKTAVNRYYPGKEATSEYREGIYVGYRYYQTTNAKVMFPFGFSLSYTGSAMNIFRFPGARFYFRLPTSANGTARKWHRSMLEDFVPFSPIFCFSYRPSGRLY